MNRREKRKIQMAAMKSERVALMNKRRIAWGFMFIVLLFFVLAFRMAYWQVVRAEDLQEKAVMMQRVDSQLEAIRGTIYDSNMKPLAQTVTEYELYGYSQYLYKSKDISEKSKEEIVKGLAKITNKSEDEIIELLTSEENLVLIAEGLEQNQVQQARELCGDNIIVQTKISRAYPNGVFAAHVIGCVNSENSGRIGLEYQYNSILSGVKGRVVRTADRDGNALSLGSTKYYEAQDGNSIVTTIDAVIQRYAEEAINEGLEYYGAESISCIVMDPKTGDILAMATTPGFDPNDPLEPLDSTEKERYASLSGEEKNDYLSRMWTNGCISSLYEPGSTFKLITSSSAIDSGTANKDTPFYCSSQTVVDGVTLYCNDFHAHGQQTLTTAVGNSCNTAHATMALTMGKDTFYNYINLYGISDRTGIDLPAEAYPLVKDKETIPYVDLATTGYGQGIAITPIQLLTAICSIGNDGKLMRPKLVKRIIDKDGNVVEEIPNQVVRQVISKESAEEMCDVMLNSVEEGGGTEAYVPGFRVGGKTGTADIPDETGGYSDKSEVIGSFVCMAPMDDPQIAMVVIVRRPSKNGRHGAATAAPIAGRIMENVLVYRGVERKYSEEELAQLETSEVTVPDVIGMNSEDAKDLIKSLGLKAKVEPESTRGEFQVVDQYPKAGQDVDKDSTVYIYSE